MKQHVNIRAGNCDSPNSQNFRMMICENFPNLEIIIFYYDTFLIYTYFFPAEVIIHEEVEISAFQKTYMIRKKCNKY